MKHAWPILATRLPLPAAAALLACLSMAACGSPAGDDGTTERVTADGPAPFRLAVPQNDLDVRVDGFRIIPPMGLGSWASFAPTGSGDEMVVMGDMVVLDEEVGPVQKAVFEQGLTVTGLHNHFARAEPGVLFMHIGGRGPVDELRESVESVFSAVGDLRGGDPGAAPQDEVENTLDTEMISTVLGYPHEMNQGVYRTTIGRPDIHLTSNGVTVTTDMGFNTWAAWQGTPERAAVAGDFAMLADEVDAVIEALVSHDIEVVATHNHMVHEEPRIFFLHYWGVGRAEDLARGLRAGLDRTGTPPAP